MVKYPTTFCDSTFVEHNFLMSKLSYICSVSSILPAADPFLLTTIRLLFLTNELDEDDVLGGTEFWGTPVEDGWGGGSRLAIAFELFPIAL